MTGTPVRPRSWRVQKWGGALPQYAVGHLDRVADIRRPWRRRLASRSAGPTYDGVGVAACVASARAAADQVLAHLVATTTMA